MSERALPLRAETLLTHEAWLRALARRMVADPATADDLVQETWLAALANPPDVGRPLRPWLGGILRNKALEQRRGDARRRSRESSCASVEGERPQAEPLERADLRLALEKALAELGEPYASTLRRQFLEELSPSEIARAERLPVGTVRWRTWRALGLLRSRLERAGRSGRSWLAACFPFLRRNEARTLGTGAGLEGGLLAQLLLAAVLLPLLLVLAAAVAGGRDRAGVAGAEFGGLAPKASEAPAPRNADLRPEPLERARASLPASAGPPRKRLWIAEHDGRPAAHWRVLLAHPDGTFERSSTDSDGALESERIEPGLSLFLARPDAPVAQVVLTERHLEQGLRLALGGVIEGKVLVDGKVPSEALSLQIATDQPYLRAELEALGLDWPSLWKDLARGRRVRFTTAADGSFCIHGLAEGWSGLLLLPEGYELAPVDHAPADALARYAGASGARPAALHYPAARGGLRVHLERASEERRDAGPEQELAGAPEPDARSCGSLSIRIEEEGRRPVAGLELCAVPSPDEAEHAHPRVLGRTDASGGAELSGLPAGRALQLSARDALGRTLREVELLALAPGEERVLALTLPAGLGTLEGVVNIEGGGPLVGAEVDAIAAGGERKRLRTDLEGRFRFAPLAPGSLRLEVRKPGYESRTIGSWDPATDAPSLAIELRRSDSTRGEARSRSSR